jgi:AraC-like DNA-binding protein/quercetin dioxygenase-like cupin family protein
MKNYQSGRMFQDADFPLVVTHANQKASMPPHCHDFIEIVMVGQGHSIHNIDSTGLAPLPYGVLQGDVFSIMPGEIHHYAASKNFAIYNIAVKRDVIENEIPDLQALDSWRTILNPLEGAIRSKKHLMIPEYLNAKKCLEKIIFELSVKREGYRLAAKIAFLEFLIIVSRAMAVEWKTSQDKQNSKLLDTMTHMSGNLKRPFSLKDYANMASMSVSSYTQKFREATGLSPLEYFINLKMEQCRGFLMETDKSITEITFACGFNDPSYLIKLFRRREGITPAKLRKMIKSPANNSDTFKK